MATQTLGVIEVAGPCPDVIQVPEGASQTFRKGDLLELTSGKATVADADDAAILGVALTPATGTTDEPILVALANENNVFSMNAYHATPASAVTAVTDISVKYAVVAVSSNWHIELSDTTNTRVRVIDFDRRHAVGDTYGRLLVKFLGANAVGSTGSA